MQQRVALRMGDDGGEPGGPETIKDFLRRPGDQKLRELDQNVTLVINGVFGRMEDQSIVDVFQRQVEVAAAMDAGGWDSAAACNSAIFRSIRSGSKANSRLACGVATISVVPDSAARRSISTEISSVLAPSSRPGKMWLWISIKFSMLLRCYYMYYGGV